MPSNSESNSQTCVWCGRNGWLLRTERFLSASCMGWCLQAAFKEHPKSTTIACAGGASSIYLANFFRSRLASRPANERLLRAGGLISVAGVTVCLNAAFDQHPKAAIKACLAGALIMCLTKSVIFSDPSASLEEKPKIRTTRRVRDVSDMDYSYSPLKLMEQVTQIGQELIEIADYFDRLKSKSKDTKEDENNNLMSVKQIGQELIEIADYFDRLKSKSKDTKEDENNNLMSVKQIGQELIVIADYFDRLKSKTKDTKEDENNLMSVTPIGQELIKIADYFDRPKSKSKDTKEDEKQLLDEWQRYVHELKLLTTSHTADEMCL